MSVELVARGIIGGNKGATTISGAAGAGAGAAAGTAFFLVFFTFFLPPTNLQIAPMMRENKEMMRTQCQARR